MSLVTLAVLAAFGFYIMKPEERRRLFLSVPELIDNAAAVLADRANRRHDAFEEALKERTRHALVVPAIATLNVIVFVVMFLSSGAQPDPDTLVAWGGNFGPRTTNVEWSRLLVSTFVHAGPLHLLATLVGLLQAGLLMERLAGYFTFAAVYGMAGFFAGAVSLYTSPVEVSVGASGAVCGIYGFLAAISVHGLRRSSGVTIPLRTAAALGPAAALFAAYNLLGRGLPWQGELAGCMAGFVAGLVSTRQLAESKPSPLRVATAVASTFVVAAAVAVPLYGMADVRPEIERMLTVEHGTAERYSAAVERFRKGVISARQLARVIERNIVPELHSVRGHLATLGRIPPEHQALVARAGEFLRLREEGWQLRAKALEAGNMAALRRADMVELQSLETLASIRAPILQ
jgi:membrane associated rhomboid family serine protease